MTERTSHLAGLWTGAAISNTSHSNKAGFTNVTGYCQENLCCFSQSSIPVSCSQYQITDRHTDPQEHSSLRHKKSDLPGINVTERENS
jgi:hypothetical protein